MATPQPAQPPAPAPLTQPFSASAAAEATAALEAAGSSIVPLTEAIARASWLDAHPGEDRQRLRAARTRLRAALAALDAQQGAEAAANASPFAKKDPASYRAADFDRLAAALEGLKWRMVQKPGGASVRPDPYYELLALLRQARDGDAKGERPIWAATGGIDFDGRQRHDAWAALKGVGGEEARMRYVRLFHEFTPKALFAEGRGELLR